VEDIMTCKWIATAALAVAFVPFAAKAQSKTATDTTKAHQSSNRDTVKSTSGGDVSSSNEVSAAVEKARKDPNQIGTPAWWANHATADGKPLSAAARKPEE
jgi:hypothetical protein